MSVGHRRRPNQHRAGRSPVLSAIVLKQVADRVAAGETVSLRPTGNSMVPLIRSRDEVVVAPVDPDLVEVGDIVLTRVAGNIYVHLVKSVDKQRKRGADWQQSWRHERLDQLRPRLRDRRIRRGHRTDRRSAEGASRTLLIMSAL